MGSHKNAQERGHTRTGSGLEKQLFSDKLSCMSRPVRIEFEGALYHVKSKRDEKLYDYNSRPDPFVRRALAVVWGCTNEQLRL